MQSVADNANQYGFWKSDATDSNQNMDRHTWVHRRCLKPMFTIANQIAYNNKMVLPSNITKVGKTGWYDVKGNAVQKQFVKEHGEKVVGLLADDWIEAIKEGNEPSSFVISPFQQYSNRLNVC